MPGVGFTTDWAYFCFCHSCFLETDVQSVIKVVFVKPEGIVTIKADILVPLGRNTDFALLMHDVDEGLKLSYLAGKMMVVRAPLTARAPPYCSRR